MMRESGGRCTETDRFVGTFAKMREKSKLTEKSDLLFEGHLFVELNISSDKKRL